MYTFNDAFKALNALEEDVFDVNAEDSEKLKQFLDGAEDIDYEIIVDPDAETEEEVQDSYEGDVILKCAICQQDIFKKPEEVIINDELGIANETEECPYCHSMEGFKVIGQVAPFVEPSEETEEDKIEDEETIEVQDTEVDSKEDEDNSYESLKESAEDDTSAQFKQIIKKIVDKFGNNKYKYELVAQDYNRGYNEGIYRKTFSAPNDYLALFSMMLNERPSISAFEDYMDPEDLQDYIDENPTYEDLLKYAECYWWGDGGDYIISLTNLTTGEVLYQGEVAFDDDDDDDYEDYDESLKKNRNNKSLKENKKDVTFDLDEALGIKKDLKEADKPAATSIEDAQKWVDYDMKKYGRISAKTNKLVKKAGFQIVKDDHGDYEVTAGKFESCNESKVQGPRGTFEIVKKSKEELEKDGYGYHHTFEKDGKKYDVFSNFKKGTAVAILKEDFEKVEIETDKEKMTMESEENGKVTVTTEPKENSEEMIAPLDLEVEDKFEIVDEPKEEDESTIDIDIDEFDEDTFDELGEKYLKRVYENVRSFKTTQGRLKGNSIKLEGIITFKSGKVGKTSFIFESKSATKDKEVIFEGLNTNFARGKKAFTLKGNVQDKKLVCESLTYNYTGKDAATNQSKRLYGRVKI